jgi:hypothetical protein
MRTLLLLLAVLLTAPAVAENVQLPGGWILHTPVRNRPEPYFPPPPAPGSTTRPDEATRRYLWQLWNLEHDGYLLESAWQARLGDAGWLPFDRTETSAEVRSRQARCRLALRTTLDGERQFLARVDREAASVPPRCRALHAEFRQFIAVQYAEMQRAVWLGTHDRVADVNRADRADPVRLQIDRTNRALSDVFRLQGVPQTFTIGMFDHGTGR